MASVQSFPPITSLDGMLSCLDTPLADGERGVLALDFDQTLMQAKPTLGDEHFYKSLMKQNRAKNLHADAHYHWTVKVREKIPYETCESVEKVNRVLAAFRSKGWEVVILTSRGLDMKTITTQHLERSGLHLTIQEVIFKEFGSDSKLLPKDVSLSRWMESSQKSSTRWRIAFADDSLKYCSEVARLSAKAEVSCFHYTGSLPNDELSEKQMMQLAFQLHAYKEGLGIPYEHDESKLDSALTALGITKLDAGALHTVMIQIAERDGYSFATARK